MEFSVENQVHGLRLDPDGIQAAFEQAGIRFLDNDAGGGIGVRLIGPDR